MTIAQQQHTVSVALCSYNGEKYIAQQLESILEQTRKVDEIVICDDGSTDETLVVIDEIRQHCDIPIRVEVNNPNLGIGANFEKAIGLCTGDIIFLSDQDDIWVPEKVQTTLEWFDCHEDLEVVFSNGYFINESGKTFTRRTMFGAVCFKRRTRRAFDRGFQIEAFLKHNRATGAAMALRRRFLPSFKIDTKATIRNGRPLHDQVIAMAAASQRKLGYIKTPLILYRVHTEQEAGYGSWIRKPPHTADLIKPLIPSKGIIGYFPIDLRERVCFGIKRRQYRKIYCKWRVLSHLSEYHSHYGSSFWRPFLRDLCWLWV